MQDVIIRKETSEERNIPLVTNSSEKDMYEQKHGNSPTLTQSQVVPQESCQDELHIQLLPRIEETKLCEEIDNEELLDSQLLQC